MTQYHLAECRIHGRDSGRRSECRVHAGAGRPAPQREGELPPPLASSTESSSAEPSGRTWTPCHLEVHYEMAIPHRLMAMIIGTVTTNDTVERSSADADSASMVLYVAARRTTMVARRKPAGPGGVGRGKLPKCWPSGFLGTEKASARRR
jgi:hypothetical protein